MSDRPASSDDVSRFQALLFQEFGIKGILSSLPGEYDLNYLVSVHGVNTHVLKVMRPDCKASFVEMQCQALDRLRTLPVPQVALTLHGELFVKHTDVLGQERLIWCVSLLPGETYALVRPHSRALVHDLGEITGTLTHKLKGFQHPDLHRTFKWNLLEAGWIRSELKLIVGAKRRDLVEKICTVFEEDCLPVLETQESQAIHNDINDHNILVSFPKSNPDEQLFEPSVSGLVDFGDMTLSPKVCELAIAAAYVVLGQTKPVQTLSELVAGFDQRNPLTDEELSLIYPLLLMRLAVSVVNSAKMKQTRPDDPYVVISERPAWEFLALSENISPAVVLAQLRVSCGRPVVPEADLVLESIKRAKGSFAQVIGMDLSQVPRVDLSVAGSGLPRNPTYMTEVEALSLSQNPSVSYYAEPRLLYTTDAFLNGHYGNSDRRTVHTGVDIFAPPGQPVYAPANGTVRRVENRPERLDYGGVVILEHRTDKDDAFWTLYGHLSPVVVDSLEVGRTLVAGEQFAVLGDVHENGGWSPHLHFQMALVTEGIDEDWLAVAEADEAALWSSIYPNPAHLLNLESEDLQYHPPSFEDLQREREIRFPKNLKLSYQKPCLLLRGWRHYLYDEMGRPYLDAYNNVPHVGHAHPRVQQVVTDQLGKINTNTRYLHPAQVEFANALTAKMPRGLSVCFFLNSASEANEVALRLARVKSQGHDIIVPDHGYHGITTGAIDISAYKFNGPGGEGPKDWVQVVSVPDTFRGAYKRDDPEAGMKFAEDVDGAIDNINRRGSKLAGFIAETFPSVGGQLVPPAGYLKSVYEKVRGAGGLCIADEVQTGLGRLGKYYWGFEQQQVVPDIVVLGKPLGNGHPVAALVTTPEIAESFVTGMEFFSTFGGSTLSCVVGREVLAIVDDEGLQKNAEDTGQYLIERLNEMKKRHPVVADVRGMGFFIGVELVDDYETVKPATAVAGYVINRLRECRILIGSDGPHDNVLKIRPPLTFTKDDAYRLVTTLDEILGETPCAI